MADRASASITIGGTLPRSLLPALLAVMAADHVCIDYGDKIIEEEDIESGFPLRGAANDVVGAEFDETEAFCRERGLRYVRRSDACQGVWDASIEVYTDARGRMNFTATDLGVVTVTLEDVRRLGSLGAIEAHFAAADYDVGPLLIVDGETPPQAAIG